MKKHLELGDKVTFEDNAVTDKGYETTLTITGFVTGVKLHSTSQRNERKYRISETMPSAYNEPHHYGWMRINKLTKVEEDE